MKKKMSSGLKESLWFMTYFIWVFNSITSFFFAVQILKLDYFALVLWFIFLVASIISFPIFFSRKEVKNNA